MIIRAGAFLLLCCMVITGYSQTGFMTPKFKVMQLTHNNGGYTIHNTQCSLPDDQGIVFDARNDDTLIKC